jgi:predicted lipase
MRVNYFEIKVQPFNNVSVTPMREKERVRDIIEKLFYWIVYLCVSPLPGDVEMRHNENFMAE